jgi:hypothetical protein
MNGDERRGATAPVSWPTHKQNGNRRQYNGEHRGYLWAGELASTRGRRARRAGHAQPCPRAVARSERGGFPARPAPTHTTRPTTPPRRVLGHTAAAEHASAFTGARTRPRRVRPTGAHTRHARPNCNANTCSRAHAHEPPSLRLELTNAHLELAMACLFPTISP